MKILTATDWRPEIAELWCAAVSATLTTEHEATVLFTSQEPCGGCKLIRIPYSGPTVSLYALERYATGPVRMFLEEDMVPVVPWSVDDYQGKLVAVQGNDSGQPWPALTIKRNEGSPDTAIIPQRFIRDGGCPEWLPQELCEPAIAANVKVIGNHFVHLDKMYRTDVPEMEQKNALLQILRQRFGLPPYQPKQAGLGDIVASGLSAVGITKERVSKLIGKPCGCKKRQDALNEFGKKFGIG